jgi:hypothetical protein
MAISSLAETLKVLSKKVVVDEPRAIQFVDLCKYSFVPRDALADAIRTHFKDAPPAERGFWAFIQWAEKRFPQLDVNASPI